MSQERTTTDGPPLRSCVGTYSLFLRIIDNSSALRFMKCNMCAKSAPRSQGSGSGIDLVPTLLLPL